MTDNNTGAALRAFRLAIAQKTSGDAPWRALQTLAQEIIGAKLFTVTTVDMEASVARRLYTNMPDAYPVSGTKPIEVDPWFELVVQGGNLFVANTLEEIAGHFPDWELIGRLGCRSCINMPVFVGGKILGTVNMLDVENHFTPERIALVEQLQIPAVAAFLAASEED
ncbi:GAF domain-containing protein [Mesorhizobium microcysteis]|uniref:GAF domain-containing protein n=1 Tax=Neoaquamicrobium microcysteis TaxID=2682781 RepID=A0A5D4GWZ0_9HYPH|nr:GAF domain-containing protein [Mesorhizobium microcysteis]TYR32908.1 GAF domain-containing protein [Mesorhizobium microcysteis]